MESSGVVIDAENGCIVVGADAVASSAELVTAQSTFLQACQQAWLSPCADLPCSTSSAHL